MNEYERVRQLMQEANAVFVFGSNELGIHRSGAAKDAMALYGALYGQGVGLQGRSYGIPTKSDPWTTLPTSAVTDYVQDFLSFAQSRQDLTFAVTKIGTGLAGIPEKTMKKMFAKTRLTNLYLPTGW